MKKFSLVLILCLLPSVVMGWTEYIHCTILKEAIKMIKAKDVSGQYKEIYSYGLPNYYTGKCDKDDFESMKPKPGMNDHPSIQGAWVEDAGGARRVDFILKSSEMTEPHFRNNNHFGGENSGLKWEDYFYLSNNDSVSVKKPKSGRFISAKNWGYSGQNGDKMNFQGAIEAYNYYTAPCTREAYYRMGHVLHLLQDMAEPDHSALYDHAGSCLTEEEAYSEFMTCLVQMTHALEIGSIACAAGCTATLFGYFACLAVCEAAVATAAGITYGACEASADDDEFGFERLINNYWDYDGRKVRSKLTIQKEKSYDTYFKKLADQSKAAAKARNFDYPLGLGKMMVSFIGSAISVGLGANLPPYDKIPGVDPNIEYPEDAGPYLSLADETVVTATNMTAGLMQNFYEIVKHPPYVKSVIVAQGAKGLTLKEIMDALFYDKEFGKKPSKTLNVIYHALWEDKYTTGSLGQKLSSRKLGFSKNLPVDQSQHVYVIANVPHKMQRMILEVKNSQDVSLGKYSTKETSRTGEIYYVTDFSFSGLSSSTLTRVCEALGLEFKGMDNLPHFSKRNYSGKELDSNPQTVAIVEKNSPYNWSSYEPGTDKNHKIRVILPDKYDQTTTKNNDVANAAKIQYQSIYMSSLIGYPIYDLTFHDKNDVDFYSFQLPSKNKQEIACQKTTKKEAKSSGVEKIGGSFGLYVDTGGNSENETSPVITFYYKDKIKNQWSSYTSSQIPVKVKKRTAEVRLDEDELDKLFPDYHIVYSIKEKSGEKACYSMTLSHHWCVLFFEREEPDLQFKPGPFIRDVLPDPIMTGLMKHLVYPVALGNKDRISQGANPAAEYVRIPVQEGGKFEIQIGMEMLSEAGELNFKLVDEMGEVIATESVVGTENLLRGMDSSERAVGRVSKQKKIVVENMKAGTYYLEVKGQNEPVQYSVKVEKM
jgi:hypothetical protein